MAIPLFKNSVYYLEGLDSNEPTEDSKRLLEFLSVRTSEQKAISPENFNKFV